MKIYVFSCNVDKTWYNLVQIIIWVSIFIYSKTDEFL
jgi:hypothetical protein